MGKPAERVKDKLLIDTSALLSLESVELLDKVIETYSVITTTSAFRELEDFAEHEDNLGLIAKRVLIKRDKLVFQETDIRQKLGYVSSTDEELFNLSLKENMTLITDDLKLLRHTTGKIQRAFSTFLLADFVNSGILSKDEALAKLEQMRNIRNWQDNIIYITTREVLENI